MFVCTKDFILNSFPKINTRNNPGHCLFTVENADPDSNDRLADTQALISNLQLTTVIDFK